MQSLPSVVPECRGEGWAHSLSAGRQVQTGEFRNRKDCQPKQETRLTNNISPVNGIQNFFREWQFGGKKRVDSKNECPYTEVSHIRKGGAF